MKKKKISAMGRIFTLRKEFGVLETELFRKKEPRRGGRTVRRP